MIQKIKAFFVAVWAWIKSNFIQLDNLVKKLWALVHGTADVAVATVGSVQQSASAPHAAIKIIAVVLGIIALWKFTSEILTFLHSIIDFTGAMLVTLEIRGWEVMVIIIAFPICSAIVKILKK